VIDLSEVVDEIDDVMETHLDERFDLADAIRRFEPAPIIRRYGTWGCH
jgi:hypothetical protein